MSSEEQILRDWAKGQKLDSVKLEDGSLKCDGTSIPATAVLTVQDEATGKTCSYTAASIFLQLKDPEQSLMKYRQECKKFGVNDFVKASDKPILLRNFLGMTKGLASEATAEGAVKTEDAAATAVPPPPTADKPRNKERHRDKKRKESSSSKHRRDSKDHNRDKTKKVKPAKDLVSNEQLFDSLNVVVDKRQIASDSAQKEIAMALSTDGFSVTPELLEEHKAATEAILSQEIPVGNSASILRAANPKKDLSRVLELFLETTNSASKSSKSTSANNKANKSPGRPVKQHLVGKNPIILVPKGMTAPLTMVNAYEFLANAKFVPRDVMVKQSRHRNPQTTFTRQVQGLNGATGPLEYEIIDNPRKLGNNKNEWDRVVAVVALGQSWQFKDWFPGYNSPATLFDRVYGYFVQMEGDKVPAEVPGWAVKRTSLHRDKRGLDQIAYAGFWNGLDEFIKVRKPEMLPQAEP